MSSNTSGYSVVTTADLIKLINEGYDIELPEINFDGSEYEGWTTVAADNVANPIVSVEYVGDEVVQCISIDDPDHLYITDDFIPTHNTSNIVFLKSTDDSMIDTLVKMSGTRHKAYRDSKTVTKDVEKVMLRTEGKVSYTTSMKEEPVIPYNVFASLPERNSIVFRAGDQPIWNRNAMILPMSWRLFQDTIVHHGHKYNLQSVPTLSTAKEFDVRLNQPNFMEMLVKRQKQAERSIVAQDIYKDAYGYSDYQISRLVPDVYSNEVMDIVDAMMEMDKLGLNSNTSEDADLNRTDFFAEGGVYEDEADELYKKAEENTDVQNAIAENQHKEQDYAILRYAQKSLSKSHLVSAQGIVNQADNINAIILEAYMESQSSLRDDPNYTVKDNGELWDAQGATVFIARRDEAHDVEVAKDAAHDAERTTYGEDEALDARLLTMLNQFEVKDAFKHHLVTLSSWDDIAGGVFDRKMAEANKHVMDESE